MKNCSFLDFIGGSWKLLLFVNMLFIIAYLFLIFSIDIEFFYSKLDADALHYYIKGYHFATQHNFDARFAVNMPSFPYASMPGLLRYLAYIMSDNFDVQLRIMQVSNILILMCVGLLFSYYLHIMLPSKYSMMTFTLPCLYLGTGMFWQVNVFLPLSDSLFTLFVISAMIRIRNVEFSENIDYKFFLSSAITALLVLISFTLKYYGFFLLVFALAAWQPVFVNSNYKKYVLRFGIAILLCITIIVYFQFNTIKHYYLAFFLEFISSIQNIHAKLLYMVYATIPEQIVPNYTSFFTNYGSYTIQFSNVVSVVRNTTLSVVGIIITCIMIYGGYLTRKKLFPEIIFIVTILPIISIASASTARYLNLCQVFFLIFFIYGFYRVVKLVMPNLEFTKNTMFLAWMFLVIALTTSLLLRIDIGSHRNGVGVLATRQIFTGTATIYRNLNQFLSSLPSQTTRLLLAGGDGGKWQAISRFTYYYPDKHLADLVKKYSTYIVFDSTKRLVPDMSLIANHVLAKIKEYGNFRFVRIYSEENQFAEAVVYKVEIAR